jgi:hypothetical protein
MAMHNPPHPGGLVRRQCLDALDLSVTEAAKATAGPDHSMGAEVVDAGARL